MRGGPDQLRTASLTATDFVPLTLFDAREGNTRLQNVCAAPCAAPAATDGLHAGGLMGYVALDMENFRRWVTGAIGATGGQALNLNGYIVYFSDRRGDHDENNGDAETGEYGNEDSINPANAAWAKTNALEVGEDFNESTHAADLRRDAACAGRAGGSGRQHAV